MKDFQHMLLVIAVCLVAYNIAQLKIHVTVNQCGADVPKNEQRVQPNKKVM